MQRDSCRRSSRVTGEKLAEAETVGSNHGSRETGRKTSSQRLKTKYVPLQTAVCELAIAPLHIVRKCYQTNQPTNKQKQTPCP
jgi:hypothetical protein